MSKTHDVEEQKRLIDILASASFPLNCLNLIKRYSVEKDMLGPRLDLKKTENIFRNCGSSIELDKKFKVFSFDEEDVANWHWTGLLVVQRYDGLEPMLKGMNAAGDRSVGSTWVGLAFDAGRLCNPIVEIPTTFPNRPQFDGDMRTMERMVPEMIALFRSIKDAIRKNW